MSSSTLRVFVLCLAQWACAWVPTKNNLARHQMGRPVKISVPRLAASADPDESVTNTALVFIKPHAVTPATIAAVKSKLDAAGCTVQDEFDISAEEIEAGGLIDAHYGTLAVLAMKTDPRALSPDAELRAKFEDMFGVAWDAAPLRTNDSASAYVAAKANGAGSRLPGIELEAMWRRGPFLKLSPGCYVARLVADEIAGLPQRDMPFTLNGFYPAMREQFLSPGAQVHALVVDFDPRQLSWQAFRENVIGATDPVRAVKGSLRATIAEDWEALGLPAKPSMAANGVHASAGPLEGLKERLVWQRRDPTLGSVGEDPFGRRLLADTPGLDEATLRAWLRENPVVRVDGTRETEGGQLESVADKVFDLTEGLDSAKVLALAQRLTPP